MPTAGKLNFPGERSRQSVASTLTFQLLTISKTVGLVKGLNVKI